MLQGRGFGVSLLIPAIDLRDSPFVKTMIGVAAPYSP